MQFGAGKEVAMKIKRSGTARDPPDALVFSKLRQKWNKSLKGNMWSAICGDMWSAIPVALLCMIMNLSEGKQGSGPEGDEVL